MQSTSQTLKNSDDGPLFGTNPPVTVNVTRAARILVDGLLIGHREAAAFHGVGETSLRRLHRMRDTSRALDEAVRAELVATPHNLDTATRLKEWATRPSGAAAVAFSDGGTAEVFRL
jgi:hypothetical protein